MKSDLAAAFPSFFLQDSAVECSSPAVCIKDSLYPLRKELLNKQTPVQSTIPKGRKTPKTGITPSSTPMTRARCKETVINSPWFKSDVETLSEEMKPGHGCENSAPDTEGAKSLNEETTRKEEEAGQSGVRTRAQKRKLSFKENLDFEVGSLLIGPLFFCLVIAHF